MLGLSLSVDDLGWTQSSSDPTVDHLVGAGKQSGRHLDAKSFCGHHVKNELDPGRLHNRQVGRFSTLKKFEPYYPVAVEIGGSVPHAGLRSVSVCAACDWLSHRLEDARRETVVSDAGNELQTHRLLCGYPANSIQWRIHLGVTPNRRASSLFDPATAIASRKAHSVEVLPSMLTGPHLMHRSNLSLSSVSFWSIPLIICSGPF
jgi:hypothetical protein